MGQGLNNNTPVTHFIRRKVTYSDFATSGNTVTAHQLIPAGSIVLRTHAIIRTPFDGSAPALRVGDGTTNDRYISGGAVTEATTGLYTQAMLAANNAYHSADVSVIIGMTHTTAPTAGVAEIIVEFIPPATDRANSGLLDNT